MNSDEQASCPVVIDGSGRDVHAEAARIREQGPVGRIELPGGVPAWSITSYAAARDVLAGARLSRDPRQHWIAYRNGEIGADFPMIGWILMENLSTTYGEDHSRLRRLIAKAFTSHRVETMRSSVEKICDGLLDDLAEVPDGEIVDLKARFTHPLPASVICDLFGVPDESRADILRGGEVNVDTTITPEESAANFAAWEAGIHAFVESKRRSPADDLTSDLVAAQEADGSRLDDNELVGTLHLLLATGTEPVMNLVANAVLALLRHPEQLELVHSGQSTWRDVIEETLRVEAPVAHLPFRFAVEDVTFGEITVPEGDVVLVNFAGIGRDPDVHGETADKFDITRANKDHLSFGYGIHRCIGMPLALMEAEIALSSLFERFPDITLAVPSDEVEPQSTFIMNGVRSLPVRLTATVHETV